MVVRHLPRNENRDNLFFQLLAISVTALVVNDMYDYVKDINVRLSVAKSV